MKRISVVGLGYIGLPTAILAAQNGYQVFGFDIDQDKIKKINYGDSIIVEPEIRQRLFSVLKNNRFKAFCDLKPADCFLISVPTPFKKYKKADLSFVFSAGEQIIKVLQQNNLVILESTVPVGTTFKLAKFLESKSGLKLGIDFFVAYCPERVLPGKIFLELISNDRMIGGICEKSANFAKNFYSKFVKGKLYITDDKTAEMVKLVENSSRDVQIAFANQVDQMCKNVKIDSYKVIEYANKHPRVKILNPTCGVGGHCIAVDPWFLIESFPKDSKLLKLTRQINDDKPNIIIKNVLEKVEKLRLKIIVKIKVLILGLTFKPDIDDMRESPALKIALSLNSKRKLIDLAVCEPNISKISLNDMNFYKIFTLESGIKWSDIVLILVKHKEFFSIKKFDFKNKIIIDSCGLINDLEECSLISSLNNQKLSCVSR